MMMTCPDDKNDSECDYDDDDDNDKYKQGFALTGRNRTGPPGSVGRRSGNTRGPAAADRPRARRPAAL